MLKIKIYYVINPWLL